MKALGYVHCVQVGLHPSDTVAFWFNDPHWTRVYVVWLNHCEQLPQIGRCKPRNPEHVEVLCMTKSTHICETVLHVAWRH